MNNDNQSTDSLKDSSPWSAAQSAHMVHMLRKHERYYEKNDVEHCMCGTWSAKSQEPWLKHVIADIERWWPQ